MTGVLCMAEAGRCLCHKEVGHVEAGDEVHACDPKRCTGEWVGDFEDEESFRIVSLPLATAPPTPWPWDEPDGEV